MSDSHDTESQSPLSLLLNIGGRFVAVQVIKSLLLQHIPRLREIVSNHYGAELAAAIGAFIGGLLFDTSGVIFGSITGGLFGNIFEEEIERAGTMALRTLHDPELVLQIAESIMNSLQRLGVTAQTAFQQFSSFMEEASRNSRYAA